MQRSALCRSRRELSNAYFLANFGFDAAENEPCQVSGPEIIFSSCQTTDREACKWVQMSRTGFVTFQGGQGLHEKAHAGTCVHDGFGEQKYTSIARLSRNLR